MPERFPPIDGTGEPSNPAIQLYGRRFYKDQTPVEYLAEFLLVFASPKGDEKSGAFKIAIGNSGGRATYLPEDRLALKLFSFFPGSKLDTRHEGHQNAYRQGLDDIKNRISGSDDDKDQAVRLLQSLFSGFVGVAKNRTWVTYSFLPVSSAFLAREVTWNHPAALQNKRQVDTSTWEGLAHYFDSATHNFLGRGGELLFLQLAHIFSEYLDSPAPDILPGEAYEHLKQLRLLDLRSAIEAGLAGILIGSVESTEALALFTESALSAVKLPERKKTPTHLGWVPTSTVPESLLFAVEIRNVCLSNLSPLDKLELLQVLCVMQVMRSLCFQASRYDSSVGNTDGFRGGYAWICGNPDLTPSEAMRRISQSSIERIESMLYRALRSPKLNSGTSRPEVKDLKNGDDNCFRLFRKFAKDLGLVIPRTGPGQRFVLPPHLLRFLVAALLEPGEHIRLTEFYARVFAHYGIALGDRQLAVALAWGGAPSGSRDYAVAADTRWIEETLLQGGFLVELSDAVSIVHNPGARQ